MKKPLVDCTEHMRRKQEPFLTHNVEQLLIIRKGLIKEIESDLGQPRTKTALDDWADQGVLLLNTALTVPPGKPKAHARIGWDSLVRAVLEHLNDRPRAFILWGGPAQAYAAHLSPHHLVLTAPHPSPLSAHRGFFGSRPFSRVNRWLIEQGQEQINWADP